MSVDLLVLVPSITATLLLGGITFLRNPEARVNRIFGLLTSSASLWAVSNYLADNGPARMTLFFCRLTFAMGPLIAVSVIALGHYFPSDKVLVRSRLNRVQPYLAVFTALLSMTPFIVSRASKGAAGANLSVGSLYFIFLLYIAVAVFTVIRNFIYQYRGAVMLVQRIQIRLILSGVLLYALFTILSNLVLPLFLDNWESSRFGPVFLLFMVALMAYTIIRHGLLDIRLVVVRFMTYIASLGLISLGYGFIVLGLTRAVFHIHFSVDAEVALAVITSVAALSFATIKEFFDRISNSIFYRDAYDVQDFFNHFNQILIATADLGNLITATTNFMTETFKSSYSAIVFSPPSPSTKTLSGPSHKIDAQGILHLKHYFLENGVSTISADALPPEEVRLHSFMTKNNISIAIDLKDESSRRDIGMLTFGPKRSGNPYSSQDLRVMATAANELVIAIQNAFRFEEIESFNATLQEKIDDATRKLRHANDKLRRLNDTKDDFISMASHQLRTPLTSVKGYVSMVLDGDAGNITRLQRRLLTQSFVSAQRMVYLISDLLNVSRLKTGKFIIEPVHCNLARVVHEEVEQLVETAKSRHLELTYTKPEHFPILMMDETKIRQVIMNFLDNAVYYTPAGGHIDVQLIEKPQTIELTVTDDGIGVPRHEQLHLFTKFYRAPNAKRARPDGTGLGLFMAKKVIIAQGGAIMFKSQEGRGSTFGFTFAKHPLLPENYRPPKPTEQN